MDDYKHRNLHRRAAEYYRSVRGDDEPRALADLEPQLLEFDHLVIAEDYDVAANLMAEIGDKYLALWGFFGRVVEMRTKLIGKLSDSRLEIDNLIPLADIYRMMGQTNDAIFHSEKALQLAEKIDNKLRQCQSFSILGGIYRRLGQASTAINYLTKALTLAHELSESDVELQSSLQLGQILNYISRVEEAARILRQALSLAEQVSNLRMQGDLQGHLGHTALWLGNTSEAIQLYSNALAIAETVGNKRGQGYWNLALGEAYMVQHQFEKSEQSFHVALRIADEISDNHLKNYAGSFLAQSQLCAGKTSEALKSAIAARLFDNPQHNDFVAMLHGVVLAKLDKPREAKEVLLEGLHLSEVLLQKTPDLLEARCTRGVVLLALALSGSFDNQAISYLLESRKEFTKAFQDTVADGVVMRYSDIVNELRSLDKSGMISLVYDDIKITMKNNLEKTGLFVELHVNNFDLAVDFYSKLGFVVVLRTSGQDNYLTMRRGRSIINFYGGSNEIYKHSYFSQFPNSTPPGYGVELVIPTNDIEKEYHDIMNAIPSEAIVEKLTTRLWGKKDFRVVDPFGFYIRYSENINWLKTQ